MVRLLAILPFLPLIYYIWRHKPISRRGWVYFILDYEAEAVKVGRTRRNPYLRLRQLQTGNAHALNLLHAYQTDDMYTDEAAWHTRLADSRLRMDGEWFELAAVERALAAETIAPGRR